VFIKIVSFYVRNPTDRNAYLLISIFLLLRIMQSGLFEFSIESETINRDDVAGFYKILFDNYKGRSHIGDLIVDESTLLVIAVKPKPKRNFRTGVKFLFYVLTNIKRFKIRCIFFQVVLVNDDRKARKKV
jgi:hypothetical protein